jgi:RNA polymerase sigma factor (sigma-70 family)
MTVEQQCALARATIASIPDDYTDASPAHLIDACARGEDAAWEEFVRRYHSIIALTAYRVAKRHGESSPHEIEDLVQDTYLKLCDGGGRVLREFRFEHANAIFGFLKVVTANVVRDSIKRRRTVRRGGNLILEPLKDPEPRIGNAAELTPAELALFIDQVDGFLCNFLPPEARDRDCTIFWLRYKQDLAVKEIASLPSLGLTVEGVESVLHRLVQLVRTHLVKSLAPQSGAATGGGEGI